MPDNDARLDFSKLDGLIPAVIQDALTAEVLMLGFMNEAALARTRELGRVTFYSRTRKTLWTKGETSGNYLQVVDISADCDNDTILVQALPHGPVCHTGTQTCFGEHTRTRLSFLGRLQRLIELRNSQRPEGSYTTALFASGTRRIAQKVGEEGVETALAAVAQDSQALVEESADLLYHLTVLLTERGLSLEDVADCLKNRHQ